MRCGRSIWLGVTVVAIAMLGSQSSLAAGDRDNDRNNDRRNRFLRASLSGFEEPPTSLTAGRGRFDITIARDEGSFDYTLSYEDIEGDVTQSHIHVGQLRVNGGISIWLCQTPGTPAPPSVILITPQCPGLHEGTVRGTVTAANVIGPAAQGVSAGEFEEVLRALRLGVTYANVHSTRTPTGEIRGQIKERGNDWWDHD